MKFNVIFILTLAFMQSCSCTSLGDCEDCTGDEKCPSCPCGSYINRYSCECCPACYVCDGSLCAVPPFGEECEGQCELFDGITEDNADTIDAPHGICRKMFNVTNPAKPTFPEPNNIKGDINLNNTIVIQ